ncbi:hypothetical protein RCL1_007616 [Eukaryota sp. TZLM3-RCL]
MNCLHESCDQNFSDFEYVSNLSFGSQGSTSLRKNKDGKVFCFKHIQASASDLLPEIKVMFYDLNSPFLVPLLHCFNVNGQMRLCMEFCEGGSLQDFVNSNSKLSNDDLWFILTQLAFGLHYLHSNSIIHRDVKPANIVLTSKYRPLLVKYCDFGISKNVSNTLADTYTGTVPFMAPEILAIEYEEVAPDSYTFAVDLWSLGVTLYYLVEGKFPFENPVQTIKGNIPVSNSEFGPIISKLLQRDASQRITANELIKLPEIQEIYDYFQGFNNVSLADYRMWLLHRDGQRQSKMMVQVQEKMMNHTSQQILLLQSHFNTQVAELNSQLTVLWQQNSNLNKKLIELEAKAKSSSNVLPSQTTRVNSKQVVSTPQQSSSSLVKKQTPKQSQKPIEEPNQGPTEEISKLNSELVSLLFPNNVYCAMDSLTFIKTAMGINLKVPKSRLTATSNQDGVANSFIAINVPKIGSFTLTLKTTGKKSSSGQFCSFIGYFDPLHCQTAVADKYFTGLHVSNSATKFITSGLGQGSHSAPLVVNDSVTITMTSTDVTYTISKFNWSKTVPRTTGWVFGMVVVKSCESWHLTPSGLASPKLKVRGSSQNIIHCLRYPNRFFGPLSDVNFVVETRGRNLSLSNSRLTLTSNVNAGDLSFVAINVPQSGIFTLQLLTTLKDNDNDKFGSFIGYFDPSYCQSSECYKYFTSIYVFSSGTHFITTGECETNVSDVLTVKDLVDISMTELDVTYTISKCNWSKTVPRTTGWVFGIVVFCDGESWRVSSRLSSSSE